MTDPAPTARTVTCPSCGGPSVYSPQNAYRPFCSERCKNIDLGAWANEAFAIPTKPELQAEFGDPDALLQ